MISLWMLYCATITLVLGVAALGAERAVRLWDLPGRWVWAGALVGSLILGSMAWFTPMTNVPAPITESLPEVTKDLPASTPATATAPQNMRAVYLHPMSLTSDRMLVAAWLTLSLGVAAVIIGAGFMLRRRRRCWTPTIVDGTPVLITDGIGPAVAGFLHPQILLPQWALESNTSMRALMIAHEREHIRAGDHRLLAFSILLTIIAPWNAALWWLIYRLRHAVELDCDARVLQSGGDVKAYGTLLLEVSRRPSTTSFSVAAFAEPTSYLKRRIHAMVAKKPRRRKLITSLSVGLSTALSLIACELPRPSGPGGSSEDLTLTSDQFRPKEVSPQPSAALAELISNSIARRHPDAHAGISRDQAVWFVADAEDQILESWVGPAFTDDRWQDFARERRYPRMLIAPFLFNIPGTSGQTIPVIWAKDAQQWRTSPEIAAPDIAAIRDTIARVRPEIIENGVPDGEALWIVSTNGARVSGTHVDKGWIGPIIPGREAQWEFLREMVPEEDAEVLLSSNFDIRSNSGSRIPVVLTHAIAKW
jgi:beta-lactamase regulating signal transducer with metallopeptidase domain